MIGIIGRHTQAITLLVVSLVSAVCSVQAARAGCATPEMAKWEGKWSYYNPVGGGETYIWNFRCVGSTLQADPIVTHGDDGEAYTEKWTDCVLDGDLRCTSKVTSEIHPNALDSQGTIIATRHGNKMTIKRQMTVSDDGTKYEVIYEPTRVIPAPDKR
jgi:hypothetical protein